MNNKPWVLVTGGAQRIGAFINKELAKSGKNIILHYNQSKSAAISLKAELQACHINVILWQADLNAPEAIEQRFTELLAQVSHIELLINNASIFEQTALLDTSFEHIQRNLNIHLTSPWLLIKALAKQTKPCQVINISDANLAHRYTSKSAYFISKKAQETLTELSAIECAPKIRVNAIAPGFVLEAIDAGNSGLTNQDMNLLARKVPLADLYSAIDFLRNNQSITGQTIQIDGGSHLKCPPYMLKN